MAAQPPPDPFKPAVREALKARIAYYGPSKSGKTMMALLTARGLVGPDGKVCVLDSENGQSKLYSDDIPGGFNVATIGPPYTPKRFADVIGLVPGWGYDVLVVDGISPAWNGAGGVQEIVDANTKGDSKFSGWAVGSPEHQRLVQAILACPIHIVCTMRSQVEWVVEQGKPRKVGTKPTQRDGIDYEFTIVGQITPEHRTALEARGSFEGQTLGTSEDWKAETIAFGEQVAQWLGSGVTPPKREAPAPTPVPSAPAPDAPAPAPAAPAPGFSLPPAAAPAASADEAAATALKLGEYVERFQAANPQVADWTAQITAWCEQTMGKAPTDLTAVEATAFFERLETTLLSMGKPDA